MSNAWLAPSDVRALLGMDSEEIPDDDPMNGACDAAADWVEHKRGDLFNTAEPPVFTASPSIKLGAAQLAHRWYQRRMSPLGVASYNEFGATEILRYDPDIGRLLGIGSQGPFVFGAAGPPPCPVEG